MGTIILLLWAAYMLYGYIKSFKTVYAKDREAKLAELTNKIKEQREKEELFIPMAYVSVVLIVLFYSIFWLTVATTFSNIILVAYCVFVVILLFWNASKSLKILKGEVTEIKDGLLSKTLLPINTVVVISFIIVLAERL